MRTTGNHGDAASCLQQAAANNASDRPGAEYDIPHPLSVPQCRRPHRNRPARRSAYGRARTACAEPFDVIAERSPSGRDHWYWVAIQWQASGATRVAPGDTWTVTSTSGGVTSTLRGTFLTNSGRMAGAADRDAQPG